VSFDAAVLNGASTVSAACIVAAGYLVSAGICFCCYSILLLREDLSRNLELTESKPIVPAGSSSSVPADYVSAGHVLRKRMQQRDGGRLPLEVHFDSFGMMIIELDYGVNITTTYLAPSTQNTRTHKDHSLDHVIVRTQKVDSKALTVKSGIEAMHDELLQFKLQKVWTLVDLPYGNRAIGTKWVYRNKKDERVARIEAIRLFLSYASFKDFVVYQMDVKSAFMYGNIEEEVYVCQPLGFEDLEFPDRVYKVERALYDLHQAVRAQETKVPQPKSPPFTNVADEAASTGVDIRYGGAATTITDLEAG
ncbi:putative ribonuclease H-like domain-containing protein, partial [Tanacetum coccineum]